MKRALWIALVTALFMSVAGTAQTVDEIIAKNVQARGGIEKLHAVKALRITARITDGDFRAAYHQENKRNGKIREEIVFQGMAQVRAYDGQTAWQINPFGGRRDPELISADESKNLVDNADVEGPLVDYKQKGHTAELIGHDLVEGTDCYKIRLTLKEGDVRYYYLDTDSFLEIKYESQIRVRGAIRYTETMLGDYDQVEGVYFPFAIQRGEIGSDDRETYTIDKIEVNVALDDSQFSLPASKTETKPSASKGSG
jgi:outer membrane lipoprotein-sorting protein